MSRSSANIVFQRFRFSSFYLSRTSANVAFTFQAFVFVRSSSVVIGSSATLGNDKQRSAGNEQRPQRFKVLQRVRGNTPLRVGSWFVATVAVRCSQRDSHLVAIDVAIDSERDGREVASRPRIILSVLAPNFVHIRVLGAYFGAYFSSTLGACGGAAPGHFY